MPQVKKQKKLYKQQLRVTDGRFGPKKPINNNNFQVPINTNDNEEVSNDVELDVAGYIEEGWGDDDDSRWEDEINLEEDKEIQSKLMTVLL
ncbi:8972_t:CDS:1, partial [Funneliformis caledonium]